MDVVCRGRGGVFVTYYLALETKNKSIDEIEKMIGSPDAPKDTLEAATK